MFPSKNLHFPSAIHELIIQLLLSMVLFQNSFYVIAPMVHAQIIALLKLTSISALFSTTILDLFNAKNGMNPIVLDLALAACKKLSWVWEASSLELVMHLKMYCYLPLVIYHLAQLRWKIHCLKRDVNLSNSSTAMVLAAYFGAALDLIAKGTDNYSQNNHAAVCIAHEA